jgi:hypothetical protein
VGKATDAVGQFRDRAADDGGRLGPRPEPQAVLTLGCWTEGLLPTAILRDDLAYQAVNFRAGCGPRQCVGLKRQRGQSMF